MKILFNNYQEVGALSSIIQDYESGKLKDRLKNVKIKNAIDDMRTSIHIYTIKNSIGIIGSVKCTHCGHEWTAMCSKDTKKIVCPECERFIVVPSSIKRS